MQAVIQYSDTQQLFGSDDATPLVLVDADFGRAVVALQGAQLLSFIPAGDEDWFWLSKAQNFAAGEDIIGGIPLCLPWFGRAEGRPIHGFVQKLAWQFTKVEEGGDTLSLVFDFDYQGEKPEWFATAFHVQQIITLSRTSITLDIHLKNLADMAVDFSWAWHSYFAVPALAGVALEGLHGAEYLDNTRSLTPHRQHGALQFGKAVDRVYQAVAGCQQLGDINISGSNCPTCIVWNPAEQGRKMAGIGEGFQQFVCVERGGAFADTITLGAGAQMAAQMIIRK